MMNAQQTPTNAQAITTRATFATEQVTSLRQKPRLEARFATDADMVMAAQRLRAEIFGAEYGVAFDGLDVDA